MSDQLQLRLVEALSGPRGLSDAVSQRLDEVDDEFRRSPQGRNLQGLDPPKFGKGRIRHVFRFGFGHLLGHSTLVSFKSLAMRKDDHAPHPSLSEKRGSIASTAGP